MPHLEGFDQEGALRRVAGNVSLYRRLLQSLLQTQGDARQRLDEALAGGGFDQATHIVHTVKGVAANLGATALAEAAACLEAELKRGSASAALRQSFADQLELTLSRLRQAFSNEAAGEGGDVPALQSPLNPEQRQLLAELEGYLSSSDGEALEMIAMQKDTLVVILGSEGYQRLAQHLQSFAFASALAVLRDGLPPETSSPSPSAK